MAPPRRARPAPAAGAQDHAEELLASALADVKPLSGDRPERVRARRPSPASPRAPASPASRRRATSPPIAFHLERHAERVTAWRGELPPRELATLGGPNTPAETTIDLHGLSTEEARERLDSSLTAAHRRGARTVLVITGHGRNRSGAGVLHREVPEWLASPPLASLLLAFATARPEHGGAGALYLRLGAPGRGRKPPGRLL